MEDNPQKERKHVPRGARGQAPRSVARLLIEQQQNRQQFDSQGPNSSHVLANSSSLASPSAVTSSSSSSVRSVLSPTSSDLPNSFSAFRWKHPNSGAMDPFLAHTTMHEAESGQGFPQSGQPQSAPDDYPLHGVSCDQCRHAHKRCDRQGPPCSRCSGLAIHCTYAADPESQDSGGRVFHQPPGFEQHAATHAGRVSSYPPDVFDNRPAKRAHPDPSVLGNHQLPGHHSSYPELSAAGVSSRIPDYRPGLPVLPQFPPPVHVSGQVSGMHPLSHGGPLHDHRQVYYPSNHHQHPGTVVLPAPSSFPYPHFPPPPGYPHILQRIQDLLHRRHWMPVPAVDEFLRRLDEACSFAENAIQSFAQSRPAP